MRARLTVAAGTAALALAASVFAASPAFAACGATGDICTGTTTVAFTVNAGTIAIVTTPAAAGAAQSIVGTTAEVVASLGPTTVTDTRVAGAGWVVSANSTAFTSGASSIAASQARYFVPSAPTAVLGTHSLSTAASTAAGAVAGGAALVTDTGTGINTASFTPSIRIDLPVGTSALAYTGTVTQSVA